MDRESVYQSLYGRLFGYLVRLSGDRELAKDVAQESFTRFFARYGDAGEAKPLLFAIARNLVYDNHRRSGREVALETEPAEDHSTPDPEESLLRSERTRRLLKALEALPENEREALSLAADKALSYKEIAGLCGISEQNVKVRVHRARQRLKKFLEAEP